MQKKQLGKYLARQSLTIIDAMQKIDLNSMGILFVVDGGRLIGAITDGDIRRAIIQTGDLKITVADIMNRNPKAVAQHERQKAHDLMRQFRLHAIPVVDENEKLTDIVFDVANDMPEERKCRLKGVPVVIMAGGQGTRLYPFTKILPKPLIPIGDVPILERIINRFQGHGADEFHISVNYRKNMIKSYFAENSIDGMNVSFVEEDSPLGTAGSLRLLSDNITKSFFVTNCDILIQADYGEIYDCHIKSGNMVTVVTALKNIEIPYGVVKSNGSGGVSALQEKPRLSYFVNTGMYVLDPSCFSQIPEDSVFHMTDLVEKLLQKRQPVGMYPVSEDSFLDMGEWEELQRMERRLNHSSG